MKNDIYNYLKTKGLNNASISGIMANMYYESNYNTTIVGDNGTSYGLCQWHAGRMSSLKNNVNYNDYKVQIDFMFNELKTLYKSLYNLIINTNNDSDGAYLVASEFCLKYEIPANKNSKAVERGNYAKKLFEEFNGIIIRKSDEEIANEVINGLWGNGEDRKNNLFNSGYDYNTIQKIVNQKLNVNKEEYYTIIKGDTLTKIAKKFDTTIFNIANLNNINDVNKIYVGDKIRVK